MKYQHYFKKGSLTVSLNDSKKWTDAFFFEDASTEFIQVLIMT